MLDPFFTFFWNWTTTISTNNYFKALKKRRLATFWNRSQVPAVKLFQPVAFASPASGEPSVDKFFLWKIVLKNDLDHGPIETRKWLLFQLLHVLITTDGAIWFCFERPFVCVEIFKGSTCGPKLQTWLYGIQKAASWKVPAEEPLPLPMKLP